MSSGLITNFLGQGTAAARPADPGIATGAIGFYWASDTNQLSAWVEAAWLENILAGSSYTDEQAQDAVGTILVDSSTIDFTYNDATPSITAIVKPGSIGSTELTDTAVTPGSYTTANITVDADGRITAASNGSSSHALPTIVQSKSAVGNSGAITLASNPTPGNLLIAMGSHWSTVVPITAGWFTMLNTSGTTDGSIILAKVADAGDLAALTPFGAVAGACVTVFEVSDWNGAVFMPFNYKQETAGAAVSVNFAAPIANTLLVGHAATLSANAAPTSITNATAVGTSVAGTATNGSPRQATPWYKTFGTKGGSTITVNYASSASQYIAGVAVIPA